MRHLPFLLLPLIAACGTPQERCIQAETRDLRTVDRLITETEGNLKRGYALEEVTVWQTRWVRCAVQPKAKPSDGGRLPAPQMCLEDVSQTVTRPSAINLANERQTLDELMKKRADLNREAAAAIAACKSRYPE